MKVNKLRDMSMDELQSKNAELTQELFNLNFQLHTGRLENTARIPMVRKDIARIKTILREKRG
ncbi:MAG TPA: 50S ribosomal protein L29 [Geobacteraceae bacterium]